MDGTVFRVRCLICRLVNGIWTCEKYWVFPFLHLQGEQVPPLTGFPKNPGVQVSQCGPFLFQNHKNISYKCVFPKMCKGSYTFSKMQARLATLLSSLNASTVTIALAKRTTSKEPLRSGADQIGLYVQYTRYGTTETAWHTSSSAPIWAIITPSASRIFLKKPTFCLIYLLLIDTRLSTITWQSEQLRCDLHVVIFV